MVKKINCPICGKLLDKRGLNGHIRTHENKDKKIEKKILEFFEPSFKMSNLKIIIEGEK